MPIEEQTNPNDDLHIRVTLNYVVPQGFTNAMVLEDLQSSTWVNDIARTVRDHLKGSGPTKKDYVRDLAAVVVPKEVGNCPVCVTALDNTADCISLVCGHAFHRTCIALWLAKNSVCPTCRRKLPTEYRGKYTFETIHSYLMFEHDDPATEVEEGKAFDVVAVVSMKKQTSSSSPRENEAVHSGCAIAASIARERLRSTP
ncbi:Aste57867_16564 [Aphanomyces stellatus]|uniref:RING-type E3 ubiquitin transferase n=1 Tax=Aphanomyces stellatus TaxID=120398 RepID=A0A485L5Q8_9STRA|nr:hypothetical protein As57867_016507 [Aphanomyces stellatus]VFT93337.1 Aste57867_16564 [Aphanomyces stellatus]